MTREEIISDLEGYDRELVGILSRFKKTREGTYIQEGDDGRFKQLVLEVMHLFRDEFVDAPRHVQPLLEYFNHSTANYLGSPSYGGVENVKGVVAAALQRVQRNPMAVKAGALAAKATGAKDADVVVTLAERLHNVVRQLRMRHNERPTLDVRDEYEFMRSCSCILVMCEARNGHQAMLVVRHGWICFCPRLRQSLN
jgi:hypothetical protein